MKILLQSAKIVCPQSPFHQKKKNVLINEGRITEIGDKNYQADKTIAADGMILTTGWVDIGAFVGDPGLEHKEDLTSLSSAAAAGGFTEVAILPNTNPTVHSKNEVSYVMQGNAHRLVQIHAIAAVTRGCKGEELTEMIDLHHAGAVAFSDGLHSVWHTDIFLKALQYLQKFEGLLIDHPEDIWLNKFGQMHEGVNSTMLGLKGMPRIAEEVAVRRNLDLLGYAGGRLHLTKLSTAKSIEWIKAARKKGLEVTCDITAYQALLDDSALSDFDTYYKVNPPLREKADVDALLKGLKDGTIDVLVSGHTPQDDESKLLEFDQADFGMINLQTFAAQVSALSEEVPWEDLVVKITDNPRRILGLAPATIDVGEMANLTLLHPSLEWTYEQKDNLSKSKNSPWLGKQIKGKVKATFNNGRHWVHD
jgi:dihydroorotase